MAQSTPSSAEHVENPSISDEQLEYFSKMAVPITRSSLHPGLQNFFHEGSPFNTISHPLIQEIALGGPEMVNERFLYKRERFRKLVKAKKYDEAMVLIEKPWKIEMIWKWWYAGCIDNEWLSENLIYNWALIENCHEVQPIALILFERSGYVGDVLRPALDHEYIVWRGQSRIYELGMSWTSDPSKAEWFAKRFNRIKPIVYSAKISGQHILGCYHGRGESEVILNPTNLYDIKEHKVKA